MSNAAADVRQQRAREILRRKLLHGEFVAVAGGERNNHAVLEPEDASDCPRRIDFCMEGDREGEVVVIIVFLLRDDGQQLQ